VVLELAAKAVIEGIERLLIAQTLAIGGIADEHARARRRNQLTTIALA
jgi:hypothetical protein